MSDNLVLRIPVSVYQDYELLAYPGGEEPSAQEAIMWGKGERACMGPTDGERIWMGIADICLEVPTLIVVFPEWPHPDGEGVMELVWMAHRWRKGHFSLAGNFNQLCRLARLIP